MTIDCSTRPVQQITTPVVSTVIHTGDCCRAEVVIAVQHWLSINIRITQVLCRTSLNISLQQHTHLYSEKTMGNIKSSLQIYAAYTQCTLQVYVQEAQLPLREQVHNNVDLSSKDSEDMATKIIRNHCFWPPHCRFEDQY